MIRRYRKPVDPDSFQYFCNKQRARLRAQLLTLNQRVARAANDEMVSYHIRYETDVEIRGCV